MEHLDIRRRQRYVCPKDVKKILLQQARMVCWKWAAKHEYEELKEGIWLDPALALRSKKTKDDWTEKHRNVARKVFLEGGWVQQRHFDIGWSGESKCQACHKEKGTKNTGSTTVQNGMKSERRSRKFSKSGCEKPKLQRKRGSGKEVSSSTL